MKDIIRFPPKHKLKEKKKKNASIPSVFCYFPVPLATENSNTNISVYKDLCQLRTCSGSFEKTRPAPAFLGHGQNSRCRAMRINPLFPSHLGN